MNALLNPELSLVSIFSISGSKSRNLTRSPSPTTVRFPATFRHCRLGRRKCLTTRALLDSATIEQLGLSESEIRNPAISSTYRSSELPRPNQTVLEAQTRVCTGPIQTKLLSEEQACKVLDTILKSARGELKDEEEVSKAQLRKCLSQ